MCIATWVWQAHPVYDLLLFLNRDEYLQRPTKAAEWWGESDQKILGGRDEIGGGTWFGCTKDGRVAFLTNFREPYSIHDAETRGDLPVRFLESKKRPAEYAEEVAKEAEHYNGFNLILADVCSKSMVYVSNRPKGKPASICAVSPGVHVLSNAHLDTPWPKAQRLSENFKALLKEHENKEIMAEDAIANLMGDASKADRNELPNTGIDPNWEFQLSSIFIKADDTEVSYGTRSMTALSMKINGEASVYERYLDSGIWMDHSIHFKIKNAS